MKRSQRLGWIGVDVGTHTVKLAQVARNGADVRLHRAAVIQRPTSWSSDDALAMEQPITSSQEIRAALECGGFSGRDAICSLPMNACQLRGLHVPPGTDRERRTIIADEMAEDWAELRHPMDFDFWEMETAGADKGLDAFNVSVLAASRPWISQLWRDCRQSGIDCWSIDGTPLSMARAIQLTHGLVDGRRALAVDWGYSNTTLCIVGDDRPLYSRRIYNCGFGRVLDAVMQMFDVTLDEAQHLIDTQGVTTPAGQEAADPHTQSAITEAAEQAVNELILQIGRTLQFMDTQRRHLHPESIWLMGGGASMRNVGAYLEQSLGLTVHLWSLPPAVESISCAAGHRAAVFSGAAALSASVWRAA